MTNRGLILYIKEALIWVFFPFDLLSQSYPSTNCHRIYLYSMNISFNFIICLFVAALLCRKLNYIVVATAFHGRCPLSKHVGTINASMLNNDVNLCLSCLQQMQSYTAVFNFYRKKNKLQVCSSHPETILMDGMSSIRPGATDLQLRTKCMNEKYMSPNFINDTFSHRS